MSDVFVQQSSLTPFPEGVVRTARGNRRAEQVVVDFWTQCLFDGNLYHIQWGDKATPIDAETAISAILATALVDNNAGYVTLPFAAQQVIMNWTTATLYATLLEVDLAKKRYSSAGTALVPRNMRGDTPFSYNGVAYVGPDVVPSAASASPNSVELKRGLMVEDNQATPDAAAASAEFRYNARTDAVIAMVDASSLILHHGSTTADDAGFGFLQFVQFQKAMFV